MRRTSLVVGVVGAVVIGTLVAWSVAGAQSDEAPAKTHSIDGVTVYELTTPDGEPSIYSLEALTEAEVSGLRKLRDEDAAPWATTGDLDHCRIAMERDGPVDPGCALMLVAEANGDLDTTSGEATIARTVDCGAKPKPGEVELRADRPVSEAEAVAAIEALNAEPRGEVGR